MRPANTLVVMQVANGLSGFGPCIAMPDTLKDDPGLKGAPIKSSQQVFELDFRVSLGIAVLDDYGSV